MKHDELEGNVTIVTGSTMGVGAGIAKRFAREGSTVVVNGRSKQEGKEVVEEIEANGGQATFIAADLRNPDDIVELVDKTVTKYGTIDTLVNNAGVQTDRSVQDTTIDDWEFVVETNFRASWLTAKYAYPEMSENGSVINVSSTHSQQTRPGVFPYNAVKAGIEGMTRAMALDFAPAVRANAITLGWVGVDRVLDKIDQEYLDYVEGIHPVGRIGTPEDVAGAAVFLASSDSSFMTGESITVDGGRTVVLQDDLLETSDIEPESHQNR